MKLCQIFGAALALSLAALSAQTVLINEVDCDQTLTDTGEFIELWSSTPNFSLAGYTLVLYNGSSDTSYLTIDLSALTTDNFGLIVIGNAGVVPAPAAIFNNNTLQNGADAVALYLAPAANFPNATPVTAVGLVDAVVYGTADPTDAGLIAVLTPGQPQLDESANLLPETQSLHRCVDGAGGALDVSFFTAGTPTPGLSNNSMCPAVGFSISVTQDVPNCGPLTLAVIGATPSVELYNLVSLVCSNGQGPLFGIGVDAFSQIFFPLGFAPFHTVSDMAGAFTFVYPSPCTSPLVIECVSIQAVGTIILGVSATTGCVSVSL